MALLCLVRRRFGRLLNETGENITTTDCVDCPFTFFLGFFGGGGGDGDRTDCDVD